MQAVYYTDKSIAVFGDTKPWLSNLKALGGRFNKNLNGNPGWIFQRSKEPDLMQFISQANAGQIRPSPQVFTQPNYSSTTPVMYPVGSIASSQIGTPSPIIPNPVEIQPAQPAMVNYPNLFTAADGLQYQIILYTAPMPSLGQRVTLALQESEFEYQVLQIESTNLPIDSIIIGPVTEDNSTADNSQLSRAIITKGEWKIHGFQQDHSLTFH